MSAPVLSVLDLTPVSSGQQPGEALRHTLDLAKVADQAGYHRFWIAEHHNSVAFVSSATEILIALAAQATRRIRVGSGGVMLPNHSPLKVAENFMSLEAIFPGRIDLGLGRAPGTDGRTALALRRSREALMADDFPQQILQLQAFAGELDWPAGAVFEGVLAEPRGVPLPPLWILGSSLYGARLAGELGLGYAFAYHFSQEDPALALQTYRQHFRPGALQEPYAILGVNALAAETTEEAQELALTSGALSLGILSGQRGPLKTPQDAAKWLTEMETDLAGLLKKVRLGTPGQVWADLQELSEQTGADELMVTTYTHDPLKRQRSYELLAGAAGLADLQESVRVGA
ncbi:LLM class flavin-dependent oxidoreductase [Deinococcus lacus]|uniref:LLM class flavin-dependent oxidoreductase n=1 Tax=Deinococcus lacus TaxID=392561 RepID=A0ABW1YET6_9DEIO